MDAIHLALASSAKADFFCTCDDRLFRRAAALPGLSCKVTTLLGLVPEATKMSVPVQPISELTHRARRALVQELGIVDAMRFLNQFRLGNGDYVAEREQLFRDETVSSIVAGIKARRSG